MNTVAKNHTLPVFSRRYVRLASLAVLLVGIATTQLGAPTNSFFTDTETIESNTFSAGIWIPTLSHTISPENPDGNDHWYVTTPCVELTSTIPDDVTIYYELGNDGDPTDGTVYTPGSCVDLPDGNPSWFQAQAVHNDNASWKSNLISLVLKIDTVAPTTPEWISPLDDTFTRQSKNILLDWTDASDENLAGYEYENTKFGGSTWNSLSVCSELLLDSQIPNSQVGPGGTCVSAPAGTFSSDGDYDRHIRAYDEAGNTSAWSSLWRLSRDTVEPTSSVVSVPASPTTDTTFDVYYSSSDDRSGVKRVELFYRKDGSAWSSFGTFTANPIHFTTSGAGTYGFYTIAEDKADDLGPSDMTDGSNGDDNTGNIETKEPTEEATVVVDEETSEPLACWATSVEDYAPGSRKDGGTLPDDRNDPGKALGSTDGDESTGSYNFVALGMDGELVVSFDQDIQNNSGDDVKVWETTWNNETCSTYPERAKVHASKNGSDWTFLGSACLDETFDLGELDWARYVKITDVTHPDDFGVGSADGYDVDAIEGLVCTEPESDDEENGNEDNEEQSIEPGDVIINEVMWMGSDESGHDEWIELYNTTNEDINVKNWNIDGAVKGSGGHLEIAHGKDVILPAHEYLLISNYDKDHSNSKLDVEVDVVATNISFKNNYDDNGRLVLRDADGNIIDQTPEPDGKAWPAGTNNDEGTYHSMERNDDPGDGTDYGDWHTCTDEVCNDDAYWDDDDGNNYGTPGGKNHSENDPTESSTSKSSNDVSNDEDVKSKNDNESESNDSTKNSAPQESVQDVTPDEESSNERESSTEIAQEEDAQTSNESPNQKTANDDHGDATLHSQDEDTSSDDENEDSDENDDKEDNQTAAKENDEEDTNTESNETSDEE